MKKTLVIIFIFYCLICVRTYGQIYKSLPAWKVAYYFVADHDFDVPEMYIPPFVFVPKQYFYWVYSKRSSESIKEENVPFNSMYMVLITGLFDSNSVGSVENMEKMLSLMADKGLSFDGENFIEGCSPLQWVMKDIININEATRFPDKKKSIELKKRALRKMIDMGADMNFRNENATEPKCKNSTSELLKNHSIVI